MKRELVDSSVGNYWWSHGSFALIRARELVVGLMPIEYRNPSVRFRSVELTSEYIWKPRVYRDPQRVFPNRLSVGITILHYIHKTTPYRIRILLRPRRRCRGGVDSSGILLSGGKEFIATRNVRSVSLWSLLEFTQNWVEVAVPNRHNTTTTKALLEQTRWEEPVWGHLLTPFCQPELLFDMLLV